MRNTPLTQEEVTELKTELSALLKKYNVHISWTCGECSDMHGVYDEEMTIYDPVTYKRVFAVDGSSLSSCDLIE